jgi:hypothetical protein
MESSFGTHLETETDTDEEQRAYAGHFDPNPMHFPAAAQ